MIFDLSGGEPPYPSLEALIPHLGGGVGFPQGIPRRPCPNPGCEGRRKEDQMIFWLLIVPEEDAEDDEEQAFYEAIGGGDSGRLRVLLCPRCCCISIENTCT